MAVRRVLVRLGIGIAGHAVVDRGASAAPAAPAALGGLLYGLGPEGEDEHAHDELPLLRWPGGVPVRLHARPHVPRLSEDRLVRRAERREVLRDGLHDLAPLDVAEGRHEARLLQRELQSFHEGEGIVLRQRSVRALHEHVVSDCRRSGIERIRCGCRSIRGDAHRPVRGSSRRDRQGVARERRREREGATGSQERPREAVGAARRLERIPLSVHGELARIPSLVARDLDRQAVARERPGQGIRSGSVPGAEGVSTRRCGAIGRIAACLNGEAVARRSTREVDDVDPNRARRTCGQREAGMVVLVDVDVVDVAVVENRTPHIDRQVDLSAEALGQDRHGSRPGGHRHRIRVVHDVAVAGCRREHAVHEASDGDLSVLAARRSLRQRRAREHQREDESPQRRAATTASGVDVARSCLRVHGHRAAPPVFLRTSVLPSCSASRHLGFMAIAISFRRLGCRSVRDGSVTDGGCPVRGVAPRIAAVCRQEPVSRIAARTLATTSSLTSGRP